MEFLFIKNLFTVKLDMITTLSLSVILLTLGAYLKHETPFFEKFCIPSPVIGGLVCAIFIFFFKSLNIMQINMDTSLQSPFMIAFFTTVGLGASFSLVKKGGKSLIIYWILCGFLALSQNIIGVTIAKLTNIHPLIGLLCGAISMEGGHGSAASFGSTIQELGTGLQGAVTVGMAAATFGVICGGLIGGPLSRYLIEKHNLKPKDETTQFQENTVASVDVSDNKITSSLLIHHILIITVCMSIGVFFSKIFSSVTGIVLPGYVGSMFVAVIFRNLNDKFKFTNLNLYTIDVIGDVSLGIFLTMALMSIKLWELVGLAGPMLLIVMAQVLFIILFSIFVVFKCLGKDFDAAVMVAGFAGHGLGATPNALANLNSVTQKYGHSTKAFLIVPIVGAFLIDLFGIPIIVLFINFFS